ncbi:hypothetical protein QCB45_11465 [Thiomicrorhabdus sp. ZW0627]|uniref:hypothetical protein n=1 Tax=Thiomicrorhabdus sp. ZW0627 TaxID=3039774 RepID=UPI002437309C|nr:hypothetical protein [Thiomicrorhabdus sp. ZW0627]MDG6774949.1 hypothetical protein [Thiomicrorhabdus sp. ZW0627]
MTTKVNNRAVGLLACAIAGGSLMSIAPASYAGVTIKADDDRWIKVGAGLRASMNIVEDAAPSGSDNKTDFAIQNMRFYLTAQALKGVQFTFNTEKDANDNIKLLDAAAKFQLTDNFNLWAGRVLIPTDRANLDGPFYQASYDFPSVRKYPAIMAGRDDGVIFWGLANDKKVKYYFGATQGRNGDTSSNDKGSLLYSGRIAVSLWDAESGYYNRSTYHGSKNILSFGIGGAYQADGAGTDTAKGDFQAWNADLLLEKKLASGGVGTLEAAYYSYDLGGVTDATLKAGDSYLVLASYMFPQKVGMGKFQPYTRVQQFDYDEGGKMDKTELGLNYVISSHNALISAVFSATDNTGSDTVNALKIGTQIQF